MGAQSQKVLFTTIYAIFAGMCIGAGFVVHWMWPIAFVGVAMAVWLFCNVTTLRSSLWYGFVCGFTYSLFVLWGIVHGVLPFDWFGIASVYSQLFVVIASWIFAAIALASACMLFAVGVLFFKTGSWQDLLLFPSMWVVGEWVSAHVFYVFELGQGSFSGPHFTLGWVGYLVATDSVLLQFAQFGGVYILSFILVFVALLLLKSIQSIEKITQRTYATVLLMFICVWGSVHFLQNGHHIFSGQSGHIGEKTIRVAAVSRYMPPTLYQSAEFKNDRFMELFDVIRPLRNTDVIVFPENTTFLRTLQRSEDPALEEALYSLGTNGDTPLIIDSEDISIRYDEIRSQSSSYFNGVYSVASQKQFLLPFGEYIPYAYQFVLKAVGKTAVLDEVVSVRKYAPGADYTNVFIKGVALTVRFCDEIMSPVLFSRQVQNGAEVLVNISSLSWFHGSPLVYENMQRMAKVRAVENGRWLVQSGNMSPAFILNQYGSVVEETRWGIREVAQHEVPGKKNTTLYSILGTKVVYIFFILIVCFLLMRVFKMHQKTNKKRAALSK